MCDVVLPSDVIMDQKANGRRNYPYIRDNHGRGQMDLITFQIFFFICKVLFPVTEKINYFCTFGFLYH